VTGGALAEIEKGLKNKIFQESILLPRPNGFGNFKPHISILTSTLSIGV